MAQSVYGLVKTVHPPTVIETCCTCNFYSYGEDNIILSGGNVFRVYRAVSIQDENESVENVKPKLECTGSYSLFGNVVSISPLHLPWNDRDILLIAFSDAKLSVVVYDDRTCDISTLSMHYFEEDDLRSGLYSNHRKPVLRVDPDLRCAAMLIYGCQLVIFPLRKEPPADDAASRAPFAPSYIIDLSKLEDKISNVRDMQFLHGYYEPTLFLLYEPIRTWAGRLPVRNDTCKIAALSLNMQEKVQPVIWSLDNLPFDCLKTLPLPKPHGGILVFAASSLLYLNQSVPPYAASLNLFTQDSSFPMKNQDVVLRLDNSHSCLIAHDQVVISTCTGEIYVLTLVMDNMRAVEKFHFDRAASSVIPSSVCCLTDGVLFLGSRVGNSLLLKYSKKNTTETIKEVETKKKKQKDVSDFLATDAAELEEELDELEVYGATESKTATEEQVQLYNFQVCDSLMNVGPCGRAAVGEPAFLSEELASLCSTDLDLELVTPSGWGKNGAITFLQRTVRPQIVTTFTLPEITDIWTVRGPLNNDQDSDEGSPPAQADKEMHSYLILSKADSTMVLQTTEEISELDTTGFNTQTPTIYAANLHNGRLIVQVTAKSVRLLNGVKQVQSIPIDMDGSAISAAHSTDPYVILQSERGHVMLLILGSNDDGEPRLTIRKQHTDIGCVAASVCLYRDISGMFTCESSDSPTGAARITRRNRMSSIRADSTVEETTLNNTAESIEEDEDELLYGESDIAIGLVEPVKPADDKPSEAAAVSAPPVNALPVLRPHAATFWALITTSDRDLKVYKLPDFDEVFVARNFTSSLRVLHDIHSANPSRTDGEGKNTNQSTHVTKPIKELLIAGLGVKSHKPHIFARTAGDALLIYEAFSFTEPPSTASSNPRLQVRFKKVNHQMILRERRRAARKRAAEEMPVTAESVYSQSLLRHFDNIGGYSGVFIAGLYPHWCVISTKGILRCHPMSIDGRVVSMAPFHNINCPRGFMYFNKLSELRLAVLPSHISYEHQWPLRKVPMKSTVHYIAYHPESKIYMIAGSEQKMVRQGVTLENEEKTFHDLDAEERYVFCPTDQYFVQLFSPVSCEHIPNTRIEMEAYEFITSVKLLTLSTEGSASGVENYFVVATNNSFTEEYTSKGRLLLYNVIEVVPEPGQPLTKDKLKELYAKEQKGPVTAISHVCGMLIAAIGQKIYVFQLKENDLVGVSFMDTQIYIHDMHTVKNLVLIADIQMSISVLRYQAEYRILSQVSRDIKPMEVVTCEFYVDNTTLGFMAADKLNNISIYVYQPEAPQSNGGQMLLRKADFNVSSSISKMFRIKCKLNDPTTDVRFGGLIEKRHVTYFVTADGSISFLLPLSERVYRRLDMTQRFLYSSVPHHAGLNPKTFRSVQTGMRGLANASHHIIDGDLVWKYLSLTALEQANMAKRMGTTPDQIMEDLLEIDRITTHF